ncbi:MAG: subclass B3 metallo-beta-lactamase [Hyphomonas sp.]|nr:subclass B3 metallo-beta-lactamase [Hyphomonas sp.]
MYFRFILPSAALLFAASCSPIASSSRPETAPEAAEPAPETAGDTPRFETPALFRSMFPAWFEPAEPFRVIGNVYFVGSEGLGIFLIQTPDGHILIDGGLPENAPMALASIRALGFDPADVKILLNTHAHFDHSGGLAELKSVTGAPLYASEGDRSALEGGFYLGSEDEHTVDAPPVTVDKVIADGDTVSLGGTTLTARITPGHTRGCTSWWLTVEEADQPYDVLIFCSATVAANRLVPNPQYEGIVDDYRRTFDITKDWAPDVFLANHPEFSGMWQARARQADGDALAFIDNTAFPAFIRRMGNEFEDKLAAQQADAGSGN